MKGLWVTIASAVADWSDADQKRRSSDDRFWEQAAIYNAGTTKPWPR